MLKHQPLISAAIAASLLLLSACSRKPGVPVTVIASTSLGDRLASKSPLTLTQSRQTGLPAITVDETKSYQTIRGFGATFNEAGLIGLNHLDAAAQENVLRSLFDPASGAGFSIMKAPIAGCDFASAGPWYSYDDTPGDESMSHFSIERNLGPNGLVTFIRRARKHGNFQLQATMDYPPDWMLDSKTNVKPEYYPALARYFVRYVQEYSRQGVTVDYLSPFNEPEHVYCKITYPEIAKFLREHLIPAFEAAGLKTKLQPSDTNNRAVALSGFRPILDDPFLRRHVHSYPYHAYNWEKDGDKPLETLIRQVPGIEIWQTEVCHMRKTTEGGRPVPITDFSDGDWWGRMLVADLRMGASVWMYWNMILDEVGGPWLVDLKHENPDNNNQHPVVIIDRKSGRPVYTALYYYLSHFSRYIRPGAVRIEASGRIESLSFVAFKNEQGGKVLVVVNSSASRRRFAIRHAGGAAETELPGQSIATYLWN